MLYDFNVHAKTFRMEMDVFKSNSYIDLKLKLIYDGPEDSLIYNRPTVSEVDALIVGDVDSASKRDIIILACDGQLQRIDDFHPSYLAFQYPLIFSYGKDGYGPNYFISINMNIW